MAAQILHVRPVRPGQVVFLSDGSRLPEAGKRCVADLTLRLHIKAGDVEVIDPDSGDKTAKHTPAAKAKATKGDS